MKSNPAFDGNMTTNEMYQVRANVYSGAIFSSTMLGFVVEHRPLKTIYKSHNVPGTCLG